MSGITTVSSRSLLVLIIWVASAGWPAQAGKIYWPSITGDIGFTLEVRRAELDGSNVEQLYEGFDDGVVVGIALDLSADKMYFTKDILGSDGAAIRRADLNGCAQETAFTVSPATLGQLAVDVEAGKIYWSQAGPTLIRRANLDGSDRETIATPAGFLPALTLDLVHAKVYWSDRNLDTVHRANLDGSSPETVLTGVDQVFGLAVDAVDGKLYWTQVGLVRRADLDGTNREDLVTITDGNGEGRAIALDLAEAKMYYSIAPDFLMGGPEADSKIFRAGLDGSGEEAIVVLSSATFNVQIALDPLNEGQDPDVCDPPVPALSAYGVAVLTLLLLVAMTVFIARGVERAGIRP